MFTVTFKLLKTHFILYICTSINHPRNADYCSMLFNSVLYVLIGSSSIVRFQNPYLQDWQYSVHFFQIEARISTFRDKNTSNFVLQILKFTRKYNLQKRQVWRNLLSHIFCCSNGYCGKSVSQDRYYADMDPKFWRNNLELNTKEYLSPGNALLCIPRIYTVISFVSTSAEFGPCTVVGLNGTLVENEMHTL
jgi:hypothetical protein